MAHRQHVWIALVILLLAAFARTWALDEAPPGLQHDEVFNALDGQLTAEQNIYKIFYASNQGREGLFVWLLSLSYRLFGMTLMMYKFPVIMLGLLSVALTYRLALELYDDLVAVTAAGLSAVSFWAVFTSRVTLRPILMIVIILGVLWGLKRLLYRPPHAQGRYWAFALLLGIGLGSVVYTYSSGFVLGIAYGVGGLWLLITDWQRFRRHLPALVVIGGAAAAMAATLLLYRINDPNGFYRVNVITRPWIEARSGNPGELIDNFWKLLGMPAFTGDPLWRYNIANRPLFLLPIGLLVYLGVGVMLWRSRKNVTHMMLATTIIAGLGPSLVSVGAPSFLRSTAALPGIMIAVGLGLAQLRAWGQRLERRWQDSSPPTTVTFRLAWGAAAIIIVLTAAVDWHAYFVRWPENAEVNAIYRDDLEQLAKYLRAQDEPVVFVSTPEPGIDAMIFRYLNPPPRDETQVVFFDAFANVVLDDEPRLLFVSPLSPINEKHAEWLTEANGTAYVGALRLQNGSKAYDIYQVSDHGTVLQDRLAEVGTWPVYRGPWTDYPSTNLNEWAVRAPLPANFGDLVQLAGVTIPYTRMDPNRGVNIQLYLQPLVDQPERPLMIFVHLTTLDRRVVAQRDLMGVLAEHWAAGTTYMQDNFVPFWDPVPEGTYLLTMGVYNWQTYERVPVLDEDGAVVADHLILGTITVGPPGTPPQ